MSDVRSANFWTFEQATQRMTRKEWAKILLEEQDTLIAKGRVRRLKARNLGAGIVEVYLEPLKERHDA